MKVIFSKCKNYRLKNNPYTPTTPSSTSSRQCWNFKAQFMGLLFQMHQALTQISSCTWMIPALLTFAQTNRHKISSWSSRQTKLSRKWKCEEHRSRWSLASRRLKHSGQIRTKEEKRLRWRSFTWWRLSRGVSTSAGWSQSSRASWHPGCSLTTWSTRESKSLTSSSKKLTSARRSPTKPLTPSSQQNWTEKKGLPSFVSGSWGRSSWSSTSSRGELTDSKATLKSSKQTKTEWVSSAK